MTWLNVSLCNYVKPHVKNLGVIFGSALKLDKQINAVVKISFFQLSTTSKIKSFFSLRDQKILSPLCPAFSRFRTLPPGAEQTPG